MSIISKRIKMARQYRKIKHKELARLCGVSPSALCHFERGRNAPKRETFIAVCKALNISSDFLLGLVPTEKDMNKLITANPQISEGMAEELLCRVELGEGK